MLIDERKHPQKLQWDDQGANTMTDKITIERETLQNALEALEHNMRHVYDTKCATAKITTGGA